LTEKILVVLDTSALLAKYHLQLDPLKARVLTTQRVVDEVKDAESREALELGLSIGRIEVVKPSEKFVEIARKKAWEIGERTSLSETDVEVAALALELKNHGHVVVVTDDYSLQNLLLHLSIPFKPLRTMGIKTARRYLTVCNACGYVSPDPYEDVCPICGSPLSKRRVRGNSA